MSIKEKVYTIFKEVSSLLRNDKMVKIHLSISLVILILLTSSIAVYLKQNVIPNLAPTTQDQFQQNQVSGNPLINHNTYITFSSGGKKWEQGSLIRKSASVPDLIQLTKNPPAGGGKFKKGDLLVYFVDALTLTGPGKEQLGIISSSDSGKTWVEQDTIRLNGKKNEGAAVDPSLVQLEDGSLRLYFFGSEITSGDPARQKGKHKVYSARSSDGINFTVEDGTRFEDNNLTDPEVIYFNDKWFMYYSVGSSSKLSTSADGLNFSAINITGGDVGGVPGALALDDAVRLFGCAMEGLRTGFATDGINFKLEQTLKEIKGCDPAAVKLLDGRYAMIYKVVEEGAGQSQQLNSNFPYFHKVNIATSKDGKTWNRSDQPTVEHASVADLLLLEKQVGSFAAGTLFLYFVDATGLKDGPGKEKIGTMYSSDNEKTWSEKEVIEIKGAEDHIPVDPSMVQLEDGTIRLYYLDFTAMQTKDKFSIYVASSKDGKTWKLEQLAFQYDSMITDPKVVYFKNKWYMYLAQYGMRVAVSEDGLSFKYAGAMNFGPEPPSAAVIDGNVEMYRCSPDGLKKTVSKDGINFGEVQSVPQEPSYFCNPDRIQLKDGSFVST